MNDSSTESCAVPDPRKAGTPTPAPSLQDPNRFYRWAVVGMLWSVSFFNYADRSALSAVMPLVKAQLQLNDAQLGFLSSSFLWVYAGAAVFVGYIGDRFPRKNVILGGLVFWSLMTFITPFAFTFALFAICRALTGLGEAAYYPAGTALIGDYHSAATRSRALSLHQTAVFVGGGIGTVIAAFIAEHYRWQYAYFLYGALGWLLAIILLFTMRREPNKQVGAKVGSDVSASFSLRALLVNRSLRILSLLFFTANFVVWALNIWIPTYLNRELHLSLTEAGFYGGTILNAASLAGVLLGGVIADRLIKQTRLGRFYILGGSLLSSGLFVFLIGWAHALPLLALCLAFAGFLKGIFDANIYAAVHDVVVPRARSTAVGLLTTIGFAGGGLSPLIIGLSTAHFGLGTALSLTAFLYLLGGALVLLARNVFSGDLVAA